MRGSGRAPDSPNELSDIQFHYKKVCRSEFALKCKEQWSSSSADGSDRAHKRPTIDEPSCNKGRVYDKKCIFCLSHLTFLISCLVHRGGIAASKGNRIIGFVRRNIAYNEKKLIIHLCHAIVRPHFEYCIQAGHHIVRRIIVTLKGKQRRPLRLFQNVVKRHAKGDNR